MEKDGKVYLKEMPLADAAAFAEKLVHIFRAPKYLWDAETRRQWREEPATPAQIAKVARIRSCGKRIPNDISKAQACEVIELDERLKTLRKSMKERGEKYFRAKAEAERIGREEFALFEHYIDERWKKLPPEPESRETKEDEKGSSVFTYSPDAAVYHADVSLTRKCPAGRSATPRQKTLIKDLQNGLRANGVLIEGSLSVTGMEQANRLIAVLLQVGRDVPALPSGQMWRIQAGDLRALCMRAHGSRMQGEVKFVRIP